MIYTKRFFKCDCGSDGTEFSVEHLFEGKDINFGPWYCDKCGVSWSGTIMNGELKAKKDPTRVCKKHAVLLKLDYDPQRDGPIHLIVNASAYIHIPEDPKFTYEEYLCPVNILHDALEVYVGSDNDRHGLFKLVAEAKDAYTYGSFTAADFGEFLEKISANGISESSSA